jgi:Glyoxalase-like domain
MPVRLRHIVVNAHDLPGPAWFWTQALSWRVHSERDIVIGTDAKAPVGMYFMLVTGPKTVRKRVHLALTCTAQDGEHEIERLLALGAHQRDPGSAAV